MRSRSGQYQEFPFNPRHSIARQTLRQVAALILVLLAASACTRQAEGPFEPVSELPTATAVLSTPADLPIITEEVPANAGDSTEAPDDSAATPTESLGLDADTADVTQEVLIFTLAPTDALPEIEASPTEDASDDAVTEEAAANDDTSFITPGSPSVMELDETAEAGVPSPEPADGTTQGGDAGDTGDAGSEDDAGDTAGDDSSTIDENCIYIVQRGDTLFRIAIAQDTNITALREANEDIADTDTIFPGQELFIPDCDAEPTEVPEPTDAPELPEGSQTHVVRAGESLFVIAQLYDVTIQDLVNANELADPNRLSVGQVLIIPGE